MDFRYYSSKKEYSISAKIRVKWNYPLKGRRLPLSSRSPRVITSRNSRVQGIKENFIGGEMAGDWDRKKNSIACVPRMRNVFFFSLGTWWDRDKRVYDANWLASFFLSFLFFPFLSNLWRDIMHTFFLFCKTILTFLIRTRSSFTNILILLLLILLFIIFLSKNF